MRFTPKEDIKHAGMVFEAGNTYSTEKQPMSESEAMSFHALGVCEVEGADPCGDKVVTGGALKVSKATHAAKSTEV